MSLKNKDNTVTLLYRNIDGVVNAMEQVPLKHLMGKDKAFDFLKGRVMSYGANNVVAFPGKLADSKAMGHLDSLIHESLLWDVYLPNNTKQGYAYGRANVLGIKPMVKHIRGFFTKRQGANKSFRVSAPPN